VQNLPNCFIEERRFCYHFLHAFLTLIILDGHLVWKHNPLHGLYFIRMENEPLYVGKQNITLHIWFIYTEYMALHASFCSVYRSSI
jgi:hypothetical protein